MDSTAENAPPARGRPRKAAPETPEARIARLQAELRQAEHALEEAEARRVAIVGAAALRHATKNPTFRRELAAALRAEVTRKGDLATVATLLIEDSAPPAPPA